MLEIKTLPVSEIKPAVYNPRKDLKPGDPAYDRLAKVLETFDLVEPLVWNKRTGNLVGGHQRFKILVARGDSSIPVSVVDLDDTQEKALNLALNKHSGEWEFATLAELLQELDSGGMDMEVTGFTDAELERLMTYQAPNAGLTDEDAVPEPPKEPKAKRGDVWRCGKHRVMCGDSTVATDVARLLGDVAPNLMVTDPPYGVNYDPKWRNDAAQAGATSLRGAPGGRRVGIVANDDRIDWAAAYALFPGAIAYVWHAGKYTGEVQKSLEDCGFEIRNQIIWGKSRFAISRGHYHWQHEPCWYAVKKGSTGNWTGDRSQTTLWQIQSVEADAAKNNHGTQKPVECMRRPILNHTNSGQCVYDPFLGSGTTVIAAEATGRIAYGMEIDPAYVDVIVQRWSEYNGQTAVLEQ